MKPTVVVTRAEAVQDRLVSALTERGAFVISLPTIAFEPPHDLGPLDAALEHLANFDWLVVTSLHAAEVLAARPAWPKVQEAARGRLQVAAAGAVTAGCLAASGVAPDLAPIEAGSRGLLALVAHSPVPLTGLRVLWPRSDIARRELAEALQRAGAIVTEVVAYRTVPVEGSALADFLRLLEQGRIDAVTFLSPSSAENLARALGREDLRPLAGRTLVASIGPTTTSALRRLGAPPQLEAPARSAASLAEAVFDGLRTRNGVRR